MNDRHTVLLVDDDKDVLLGASKRLGVAGYEVLVAYDGVAGLASAMEHLPHAIVLDVRMPHKDGLATLAELRSRDATRDIPVVILSASLCDQRAALEAGARFFLRKPYSGPMLIDAVKKAIAEGVKHKAAYASAENHSLTVHPINHRSAQSAETTSAD
jgi:CheY-like chemotaxis protein